MDCGKKEKGDEIVGFNYWQEGHWHFLHHIKNKLGPTHPSILWVPCGAGQLLVCDTDHISAYSIMLPLATCIYSTAYGQLYLQTKWNARIYSFFITWPL